MSTKIIEKENGQMELDIEETASKDSVQTMVGYENLDDSISTEPHERLKSKAHNVVTAAIDDLNKLENHARNTPGETERLEESIRLKGIFNPPKAIRTKSGKLKVFDGWRCVIAAKKAGIKNITVIIYDLDEDEAGNLSYLLNEEQESLGEIDKAKFVKNLVDKGRSFRQIADDLGYGSSTTAYNLNQLNSLPESIQSDISHNNIDPTKARQLLKLPNDELREQISKKIQRQKLSVQQAKEAIEDALEQLEKEEHGLEDVQNQATEFSGIYTRNQSKISSEVEPESVGSAVITIPSPGRLKCYSKFDLQRFLKDHAEIISDSASAVKKGGNVAVVYQDYIDDRPGMSFASSTTIFPFVTEALRRRNVDIVGKVTAQLNSKALHKDHRKRLSESVHTQFPIRNNTVTIVFYRKGEGRDEIPQDLVKQSILPEDQLYSSTDCVWSLDHDEVLEPQQDIYKKIIRLTTFVGDTVLFPFCFNCDGISAAHSVGRKVIGYFTEPDYRRNPLVEIFGEPKSVTISPLLDSVTSYLDSEPSTLENALEDTTDIKEMTVDQSA